MKRLMIISLFLTVFATGCFFYEEADTVNPGDESYYNPTTPEGSLSSLTASVSSLSDDNPYITITFDSPIDTGTVTYDSYVQVIYTDFSTSITTTLTQGSGYVGITNKSKIVLDLSATAPQTNDTIRVILTSDIKSYASSTISLTPVDVTRTLP